MRKAVKKKFGPLDTFTLEGSAHGPAVILFHGYGADAGDLLPLADMMGLGPNVTWIFPDAPMQVIIAPGFYGKAWFPIDNKRLEAALQSGEPADMSKTTPSGIEGARKSAIALYDEVAKQHSAVIIGGFSQGAMLSLEVALSHTQKPAGMVLMSGTLISEERWTKLAPSCEGLTFIQTHGKNDALLGFEFAERLYGVLTDAGLHGDFVSFNGGHEIPPKALQSIGQYIASVLKHKK